MTFKTPDRAILTCASALRMVTLVAWLPDPADGATTRTRVISGATANPQAPFEAADGSGGTATSGVTVEPSPAHACPSAQRRAL